MYKRGDASSVWVLIGAILAIIMLTFSTYVFFKFGNALIPASETEQSAQNNFNQLYLKITKLLDDKSVYKSGTLEFQVPPGFILVGFDRDWHGDSAVNTDSVTPVNDKIESNWCDDGEGILKPQQCFGKSCLCMYKVDSTFGVDGDQFMESGFSEARNSDDVAFPCHTFDQDIVFVAPRDSVVGTFSENNGVFDGAVKYPKISYGPDNSEYEFLVAFGSCDGRFPVDTLYVEKFVSDMTYIFVSQDNFGTVKSRKEWAGK